MELMILLLFLALNSIIVLFSTNAPLLRQSFILGLSGATVGGLFAIIMKGGLSPQSAEVGLLLLLIESSLIFLLTKLFSGRYFGA